jgi:sugar transferase (PEP-CTERM/EpsH1 system associated)
MRVLFLTHRVPYAPNRGDRIRAYHMLRYFRRAGIPVCLVAFAHDDEEQTAAGELAPLADAAHVVRVPRVRNLLRAGMQLVTHRPLTHVMLDSVEMRPLLERIRHEWQPDVVLAFCSGMARFALEAPLDTLPFVLDMVDVDSLKWEEMARKSRGVRRWIFAREARLLRRFEARATHEAQTTFVVSQREGEALRALDASFEPVVLPNGVDLHAFRNAERRSTRPEVVFSGVFSYPPNEEGALWLIDRVWPLLRRRQPDAHLTLVGMAPGRRLRSRAAAIGADITGAVTDVRPFLWRAAVAAAPLHTARGVQNKVLEAVAAGLPVIVTPAVFDGLPPPVRPACLVAATVSTFADSLADLLASPERRRELVAQATDVTSLTWEARLQPLADILWRAARVAA